MDPYRGILCVDIETCSARSLPQVGAWAYSEHESTRVWCVSFAYAEKDADAPVVFTWRPGVTLPERICEFIVAGGNLLAFNAPFERSVWRHILCPRHRFPEQTLEQWHDAQALALAVGLPASLEGVGCALGGVRKDMTGKSTMTSLMKVERDKLGDYVYPQPTDAEMERLVAYCEQDCLTTLHAWFRLPKLSTTERLVWLDDQRINERGVPVDVPMSDVMLAMVDERKKQLSRECVEVSEGDLATSTGSRMKLWLTDQMIRLPVVLRPNGKTSVKLTRDVVRCLVRDDVHGATMALLVNRVEASKATSLAKLKRIRPSTGADGRLHYALRYCGAHTGRWSSSGLQVHNLPKDKRSATERAVTSKLIESGDLEGLSLVVDSPLEALSCALRSLICASPGCELIAADYSAIEARVVAWLAGADDKLDVFRRFDATAGMPKSERMVYDPYVVAAQKIGSDNRQIGKVCELALGYGMGVLTFAATAANAGVPLSLMEARRVQRLWRAANESLVEFWDALDAAAKNAIGTPGSTCKVGRITARSDGKCLRLRLPSGRSLHYWRPSVVQREKTITVVNDAGDIEERTMRGTEVRFYVPGGRGMVTEATYGGKLVENVTQAVSRDLMAAALLRFAGTGYAVCLHVHDQIAAEVPAGTGDVDEFCAIMSATPKWAAGLPVAVEGYRSERFRG